MLTKEDIEQYITDTIKLSAKQMVELLVERIDVFTDKICIKLKYSDTPIEPPTDFSDEISTQREDIYIRNLYLSRLHITSKSCFYPTSKQAFLRQNNPIFLIFYILLRFATRPLVGLEGARDFKKYIKTGQI